MEWYRHKTWSKVDEEYFFAKLKRARKDGQAQYLKVQAVELFETKDEKLLQVAESLINKLFDDFPDDKFNRSSAFYTLGRIYEFRNHYDKAIEFYKHAIDFEVIYPQVKTAAYLEFSELVIKQQKVSYYNIAEIILTERISDISFPIEKYKGYSILSIINNHKGNNKAAVLFSELAEKNANEQTSGLRYHKYLGVVKERDSWLDKLVEKK